MNKELFSFLSITIALFIGAMYFTNVVQSPFISSLNYLKATYHDSVEFTQNNINKYLFQASTITKLSEKLEKYENNHLVMQQLASEVNDLFEENKSSLKNNPKVELVRVISYKNFGDFNKLWIDLQEYNASKIYGLVYKETVAGIVISQNNHPLALLNKDKKCTYAVHVGSSLAPGIAHGNNGKNILVKYIPAWFNIKVGDEVVSSGLDKIFFKGLKVGKVISCSKANGFQTAVVEPYYKSNDPSYFHLIKIQK
jgi:rod shape-determining protein MreC